MRRLFSRIACAAVVAAALTVAAPSLAQDSYKIGRVYKAGETDKYRMTMNVDVAGQAIVLTLETTETTKEVKPSGEVIVETSVDKASASIMGMNRDLPIVGKKITSTYDKTGKETKTDAEDENLKKLGQMMSATRLSAFGDRDLKVGEELKVQAPGQKPEEVPAISVKLLGVEPKSAELSEDALKLKINVESPAAEKVKIELTSFLDKNTRKVLKVEGKVDGKFGGLPEGAKVTLKRVRI